MENTARQRTDLHQKKSIREAWWFRPILVHYLLLIIAILLPYYNNVQEGMTLEHIKHALINWDSHWYIGIAERGYESEKAAAFFPFVPILLKIFGSPYIVIGITQIAFFICLCLLREFFKRFNMTDSQMKAGIWFFAVNPCAIYYATIYTEVWTVLFSLASLHMAVKGKWFYACLFAAILTSTRATALIFGIFPLVLFLMSLWKKDWKMVRNSLLWGMSCTIGLLCYMIYLYYTFGDPMIFSTTQEKHWDHYSVLPWVQIIEGFHADFAIDIVEIRQGLWTLAVLFAFFGTVSIWRLRSNVKWESLGAILFVVITIIFTFSFGTRGMPMHSTLRYLSVLFPLYAVMAIVLPKPLRGVLIILFAIVSFMSAWNFTHHIWNL
ncbi:mannosyltransferase family protein [Bacillus sp. DX1.1]|uniref:mannosyltransferase family protein n=1 Tax=unclassified Bacillus (in: firmicutes) TaxID=185979 RepID=UPI0025705479|nr:MULTISPECIES: mannosyltransferase family protein [unclassified Bacillus (in: firmicutes)]MDM5157050.1 mannosyltransferase family protein [Bacillus sp. DX1.1]WJE81287.1 mannosyltransferase family protein [Bacillus sp. DX3.1]